MSEMLVVSLAMELGLGGVHMGLSRDTNVDGLPKGASLVLKGEQFRSCYGWGRSRERSMYLSMPEIISITNLLPT